MYSLWRRPLSSHIPPLESVEKEVDERERERKRAREPDGGKSLLSSSHATESSGDGGQRDIVHLASVRQWSLPSYSLEEDSVGQKTKVSGGSYAEETSPGLRIAYFLWSRTLWEILRIHFGSRQASLVGLTENFEEDLYFVHGLVL